MASQQPSSSVPASPSKVSSEDIISQKTDLCVSNAIVKTGIGFSAGVVLSVLLFRRRAWPVWLGTGFGLGSGWTDCERSFNPVAVPGVRIINKDDSTSSHSPTLQKLGERTAEAFDQAKQKGTQLAEQSKEKTKEAEDKARVYPIRSTMEKGKRKEDCLPCRLVGFFTLTGLGAYSLRESYRIGAFSSRPPKGASPRARGVALVFLSLGCLGAGAYRLVN